MKLPGLESAVIPREKIEGYLLSSSHPTGQYKARFFAAFGFWPASWEMLAEALRRRAVAHEVAESQDTEFGTRYIVEGALQAPDGRRPEVRVVWFLEHGETAPRLVTVYPR